MKKVVCIGLACLVVVYAYTADDQDQGWMGHYWNKAKQYLPSWTAGEASGDEEKAVEKAGALDDTGGDQKSDKKSQIEQITSLLLAKGIDVSKDPQDPQKYLFKVYHLKNDAIPLSLAMMLSIQNKDHQVLKNFLSTLFLTLGEDDTFNLKDKNINIHDAKNHLLVDILDFYARLYTPFKAVHSDEFKKLKEFILSDSDNEIPIKEKIFKVQNFLGENVKKSEEAVLFVPSMIKGVKR